MADAHGSAIGKYRIIELVGEGVMGVVYRAQDSVLDRTVAIKVMNDSIARQEVLRKRFLHEAQAAGSLQHPNVVCIYDFGEVDGHLFIAMEFVHGVDGRSQHNCDLLWRQVFARRLNISRRFVFDRLRRFPGS